METGEVNYEKLNTNPAQKDNIRQRREEPE